MYNTISRLLELYGPNSKGIVWAHNTHIGDARYTEMQNFGQTNIGELTRSQLGDENVMLIGFTTYQGQVQAGSEWGARMETMRIRNAPANSLEGLLHRTGIQSFYLIFDQNDRNHPDLLKPIGNRAIGVIYRPAYDHRQYVPTIVPWRYDALIFINRTTALRPFRK